MKKTCRLHSSPIRVALAKVLVLLGMLIANAAHSELMIEITEGVDNPTTIAVVPFAWKGHGLLKENVADVVIGDLERSGLFRPLPKADMLALPHRQSEVQYSEWRTDYIVVGRVKPSEKKGEYQIHYELFDVYNRKRIANEVLVAGEKQLRRAGHHISDAIYERIIGEPGAFATKILYVSHVRKAKQPYRLMVADVDGYGEQSVFRSTEPIMSPSWSPDGRQVTYVSFETRRPAIYIHVLATGKREKITSFRGLNSSPSWSPDGKSMAMVLSKDGNPEVYVMDLKTRKLRRVTNHFGIDTEPSWTPDGRSIIFTSSRGGQPQIYQVSLSSGWVERVTFDGDYNARSRVLPDGKSIVFVHRDRGNYYIASLKIGSGELRVLTKTTLDESPSVAPNGSMLLYATQIKGGQGILGAVSVDGGVKFQLPSGDGDVREPAWSPWFK